MRFRGILPEPRRLAGYGLRWTTEQIRVYLDSLNAGQKFPLLGTPEAVDAALAISRKGTV
jgi:hypothetical protein